MLYVLQIIRTISSKSNKVCERIIGTGLHEDMLKVLSWDQFSRQSRAKQLCAAEILLALQYVVRRVDEARVAFRECHAVDILQKFRDIYTNQVIICLLYTSPSPRDS